MTTTDLPSGLGAVRQIAGMSLRRTRRGGMIWLTVVVLGLLLLGTVAALISGKAGLEFFNGLLSVMLCYLTPLIMALHGSSAVSEEAQAKTVSYLFSRPIPRWSLPMGKYAGTVGLGLALLVPALVLLYVISMLGDTELFGSELPHLGMGVVAMVLAVLLYGAVATAFGTFVTSYSFVVALVYLLVVEVSCAFIPGWLKVVAMSVHLRVVAGLYEPKTTMFMQDPNLTAAVSIPVLLAEIVFWLFIAASWVQGAEYRTDK